MKDILDEKCLSNMEIEVIKYLAEGLSNKEIAERLIISTSTVKKYLESIYLKLSVHNRLQAVLRAIVNDIITL